MKHIKILHIVLIFSCLSVCPALTYASPYAGFEEWQQNDGIDVVANSDAISMDENGSWIITVTNNDYGLHEGISELSITKQPENGEAEALSDFRIRYTPNKRFVGKDLFEYSICNNDGNCDEALVYVTVLDRDYIPTAVNDTIEYYGDGSAIADVLENDENIYDYPLQIKIIQDVNNGFSEIRDDLTIELTFTSYFLKKDSLIYEVCDVEGDCDQGVLFVVPYDDDSESTIIPEAFSPNRDGHNDTFRIPEFDDYQNMSLLVFNRNGIVVFDSPDYDNNWNGEANKGPLKGEVVPKGVYFYILKFENGDSESDLKGNVFISH